jgi:2-haloalkanoic acid dehalogenase type II
MSSQFDIITFDCYGTLIDWERGIRDAFAGELSHSSASPDEALALYALLEPIVQREQYRSYREVLDETASRVLQAVGVANPSSGFLSQSLASWTPFADTNPALVRLRDAGIRLGLLSNIDDDLLAETRKHFTVDFDLIITAAQVGSYKPAEGHFTAARAAIGKARWLHAAQSYFHDIVPTRRLGIRNAWINRKDEEPTDGGRPDREYSDLGELASEVAGTKANSERRTQNSE